MKYATTAQNLLNLSDSLSLRTLHQSDFLCDSTEIVSPKIDLPAARARETRGKSGPKTAAGKRRSSKNATRHGLYSSATVIPAMESQAEYERFTRMILADLEIHTSLEMALVERIISTLWRLRRVRRYETERLGDQAKCAIAKCAEDEALRVKCQILIRSADLIDGIAFGNHLGVVDSHSLEYAMQFAMEAANQDFARAKQLFDEQRRLADPIIPNRAAVRLIAQTAWCGMPRNRGKTKLELRSLAAQLRECIGRVSADLPLSEVSAARVMADALVLDPDASALVNMVETRLDRQLSRAISDLLTLRPDLVPRVRVISA